MTFSMSTINIFMWGGGGWHFQDPSPYEQLNNFCFYPLFKLILHNVKVIKHIKMHVGLVIVTSRAKR